MVYGCEFFCAGLIVFLGGSIYFYLYLPDHEFGAKEPPDPPDYRLRSHWAAWRDKKILQIDCQRWLRQFQRNLDQLMLFFLHPAR